MKHTTIFSFFLLLALAGMSQDSTYYEFEVLDQPYESLVGATVLSSELWDDSLGWDDPEFIAEVGFEFSLYDSTFTHLAQGDLGTTLYAFDPSEYDLAAFFLLLGELDVADLGLTGIDTLGSSTIQWATTGEPGSQVFALEYVNAGFYEEVYDDSLTDYSFVNFQFRLFEEDGTMELHFGDSHVADSAFSWLNEYGFSGWHVFLTGGTYDDYNLEDRGVFTNINSEESYSMVTDFFEVAYTNPPAFTGFPTEGRLFRYTRQTVEVESVEEAAWSMRVWPNPAQSHLTMELHSLKEGSTALRLTNMQGQTVWSQQAQQGRLRLDVSGLPNGMYLLQCGDRVKRVVVQH